MIKLPLEEVQSYWDERIKAAAGEWEGVLWQGLPTWNDYVDKIQMHHLGRYMNQIKTTDTVLDVGCGIGRFTFRFAKLCKEVYGIDSSKEAILICKRNSEDSRISNAKFQVMDVRKLTFNSETFDWVFSITCLQHITNKMDLTASVEQILRVAKTGGKIVLIECTTDKRKSPYVISLSRSEWFQIIRKAGGRIESFCGIDVPILRKLLFAFLHIGAKLEIKAWVEKTVILLKPFEYVIPKLLKSQSRYFIIVILK